MKEADNGADSSDDFVPGKVSSGKGPKKGRGRPKKILMAAALPPDRAEVEQRRQREKESKAALAKAKKEAAEKAKKAKKEAADRRKTAHPSQLPGRLVPNPKTVAERRDNSRFLQAFNVGHNDDLFGKGVSRGAADDWQQQPKSGKATKKAAAGNGSKLADGILNELFDSDSENDLSIHSSRTPIGKYLERGSKTPLPEADDEDPHLDFEDRGAVAGPSGFMANAYIHRKLEEKKKTERRKRKLHSLTSTGPSILSPGSTEGRMTLREEEPRPPTKSIMKRRATEIRLEEPISKIMHQMESSQRSEDGCSTSSDRRDEYFNDSREGSEHLSEIRAISKKISAGSRGATIVSRKNR